MNYKIIKRESFTVIAKTIMVSTSSSTEEIPNFWTEYFNSGLHGKVCGMIGICEQSKENNSQWKYGIGCEEKYVKHIPKNFDILKIPAYTWAVFKCIGPVPVTIQEMWKKVYSEWLPQSKYELINDYDIEFYSDGDIQSDFYESEIWIPVKEKKCNNYK
ncbi:GyrI-like domain-containing protein [Clostridium senegalense]